MKQIVREFLEQQEYCSTCGTYYIGNHFCHGHKVVQDWGKYLSITGNSITVTGEAMSYSGTKPVVICNGQAVEVVTTDL